MRRIVSSLLLCSLASPALAEEKIAFAAMQAEPDGRAFGQVGPVKLKAEITQSHEIYLPIRVNGSSPMWFLVDSAAGLPWILDESKASLLGLALSPVSGQGPENYRVAKGATVSAGDLIWPDQTISVMRLDILKRYSSLDLAGIVGSELFTSYVVEIAYGGGLIALHDKETYRYQGAGFVVPVELRNKRWYARATVQLDSGEVLTGRFLVDTGAGQIAAALTRPFVDVQGLLRLSATSPGVRLHRSLGGVSRSFVRDAPFFSIGGALIPNVTVDLSRDAYGILASSEYDGVIGGFLLHDFKIIFDPGRQQMVFESNHGA